ncbi:thermonuclease family protein [Pseudonocardia sediminis]|uniref:thermonuclease family protein n=1 Tax=Pseudonocardia sediminis TaxID=1397368 RepID=UPI001029C502|nr:thermonuclease family protein [Pseudonocardia sediminis]
MASQTSSPATVGELVSVTKVVDGDTIEVTGGRKVRFLGIDACETDTRGGREARESLELSVSGQQVRLVADGRRDVDDYGRLLRRVERDSTYVSDYDPYINDIGLSLIGDDAVGVYERKNDAPAAYLAELRERDYSSARDCTGTPVAPASSGGGNYVSNGDVNMPDGALTGGYCARKWWC